MVSCGNSTRRGFTMVELLVVIVIIAILASLLVVGLNAAVAAAKKARIRAELMGLAGAFEQYRVLHNEYPPSDPGTNASGNSVDTLGPHLNRLFSRRDRTEAVPELDQAECIFFWLAGYSGNDRRPVGYTGAQPIGLVNAGERSALFDFDQKRFYDHDGDGIPWYIPAGAPTDIPYVYFHKKMTTQQVGGENRIIYQWYSPQHEDVTIDDPKAQVFPSSQATALVEQMGQVYPVYWDDPETVADDDTAIRSGKDFQIVCAGLGDKYDPKTNIHSLADGTEED